MPINYTLFDKSEIPDSEGWKHGICLHHGKILLKLLPDTLSALREVVRKNRI